MSELHLGVVEARFADIVWQHQPVTTGTLVKLCERELRWKKTTTYTVLKRLCDKGLFMNEGGTVTAVMTREEFYARQSERFVTDNFGGSLPAFLAAFTAAKELSEEDVAELRRLIDAHKEG